MRHLVVLVAVAVSLLIGGCGEEAANESAAGSGSSTADGTTIAVIGDFGVGGPRQRRLGASVERFAAKQQLDLVVTVGDNDYANRVRDFKTNWRDSFGWLARRRIPVAGALGNHDVELRSPQYQFRTLGMPSRYYARTVGEMRLVVLDSNALDQDQRRFLRDEFARAGDRWPIVILHHPPYTCGVYRNHTEIGSSLVPDLQRLGVRLVLAGHDHNYQRFEGRDGEMYVVNGWGAGLYRLGACSSDDVANVASNDANFGFLVLDVTARKLRGRAITVGGKVVDDFSVTR